jgi:hypothetical protein
MRRRVFDQNIIDKLFEDVSHGRSRIILWDILNLLSSMTKKPFIIKNVFNNSILLETNSHNPVLFSLMNF